MNPLATLSSFDLRKFKVPLVVAAILLPFEWYAERVTSIGNLVGIAIYVSLFALASISIILTGFSRNVIVRVVFAILFAACAFLVESYRQMAQEMFTYDAFVSLYLAVGFANDAIAQYGGKSAIPPVVALLLFVGTVLPPRTSNRESKQFPVATVFPLVTLSLLLFVTYIRGGHGLNGQPGAILPLVYGPLMALDVSADAVAASVRIAVTGASGDFDIVLLIDESIRADYLDVIETQGLNTNLRNHSSVANFGVAAAATNCSYGSNLILRYGGTRSNYRRKIRTSPSIWRYARAVGMNTVYLDGQRTGGLLQNGMTEVELSQIDEFIQFDDTPVLLRDIEIARRLAEYSRNGRRDMIVVNKVGAHFPVHDKFPDDFMAHTPVLVRGKYEDVSDFGGQDELTEWGRYKNSYKNTILWNVGEFFNTYFANADLGNAIIIYTSDHGQDFHDDGSPGFTTHCSSDPSPLEGQVFSIVITEQSKWRDRFQEWSGTNFNRTSHYNIFSTALVLMGYDEPSVRRAYGRSLLEPANDDMTFNSAFHARFGRKPKWNKIRVNAAGGG